MPSLRLGCGMWEISLRPSHRIVWLSLGFRRHFFSCVHILKKDLETDKSNMANIVVYCNLDRYQKTNRRDGALYDPDSKVYQAVSDPTFQSCKSGIAIPGTRRPLALTNNYKDLQKVASKVFGRGSRDG